MRRGLIRPRGAGSFEPRLEVGPIHDSGVGRLPVDPGGVDSISATMPVGRSGSTLWRHMADTPFDHRGEEARATEPVDRLSHGADLVDARMAPFGPATAEEERDPCRTTH
jgi:hypothetical protein